MGALKVNLLGVIYALLERTVRTFETTVVVVIHDAGGAELVEGVAADDMPTLQLHRRILFRGLLPQNRTGEDRVVSLVNLDFDLKIKINKLTAQNKHKEAHPTGSSSLPDQMP